MLASHDYYELPAPVYRGIITAVRPSGSAMASVKVTELYRNGEV
jgi:hypothetical protein